MHTNFINTDRHILVNLLYAFTGFACMFLHISFIVSCISGEFGFSTEWLNGRDFFNSPIHPEQAEWGILFFGIGFLWGISGTWLALYVGYIALCHLYTALSKVARFVTIQISHLIEWADNTKIA